jgi:hypothetical protein
LHKQGLLLRGGVAGRVAYKISERGIERLKFLNAVHNTVGLRAATYERAL